jgi:hypothetical protein
VAAAPALGYSHWGTAVPEDIAPEPNNLGGAEYCAGANMTEQYGGAGGWGDERCGGAWRPTAAHLPSAL